MPTSVETLLAGDDQALADVVGRLDEFLHAPERHSAIRLAVLGLTRRPKDKPQWADITKRVETLLALKRNPNNQLIHVTEHTIKRFALGSRIAHDRHLSAHLALFVVHELEGYPEYEENEILIREALSLGHTIHQVSEYVKRRERSILYPHSSGYDIRALLTQVRRAFNIERDDHITQLFFGGEEAREKETRNVSHYIMYRYSTKRTEIVKSFLAIIAPEANGLGCYSFTHVYGRSGKERFKRTSRGVLLNFERSIYFLSVAGSAADSSAHSLSSKSLKVFAIPHTVFAPDYRLLTGLMLSNSLSWEPIVARFAIVHLGFRPKLGELGHDQVNIRFLKREKLDADIEDVLSRCGLKSEELSPNVSRYIKEKINNYPTVDLKGRFEGLLRALGVEDGSEPRE